MNLLGRWASVICSDATEEPVDLSYELVEAVNDALPTGYAVGRLSIVPAADYRGAVDALQAIVDLPCPLGREGDPLGAAQKIASAAITALRGQ
jgi:hypothetical protein